MTTDEAMHLSQQYYHVGRLAEAETLYRQILARQPNHPDALHMLGLIAYQVGRGEAAIQLIRHATTIDPGNAAYHCNLGEALRSAGRIDEAIAAYTRAIELQPGHAKAYNNLGLALRDAGKPADALAAGRRAVELDPNLAAARNNLGTALRDAGECTQAVAAYRKAIELNPRFADAWCNLGTLLLEMGDVDEATASCARATQISPALAETWYNLGNGLYEQNKPDEAIAAYERTLELKPEHVLAHNNMANTLKDLGMLDEALACYDRAIAMDHRDKDKFKEAAAFHGNRLFALHFLPASDPASIFAEHQQWNLRHAAHLAPAYTIGGPSTLAEQGIRPHSPVLDPNRRIKIGYVSPDLCSHPVGRFMLPLLKNHDHAVVEAVCYSDVRSSDQMTERLRCHADVWRNTFRVSDDRVAQQIREDQIDILVDLAGHTGNNRMLVFARKPCPIQVTYLGYPDTTGLRTMDYRLTDSHADPPGMTEAFHTERLTRLPDSFLCYSPTDEEALPVAPPPALVRGHVTFGSFNALPKINATLVAMWAQILRRTPGSKFLIKCKPLSSGAARQRLLDMFAVHEIGANRLELQSHLASHVHHLRAYDQVDIALDTFPYHGTTTTCEALWMGVPVISLAGKTHVSRVGASILHNAGLPGCVAQSHEQYVGIASEWAGDFARLSETRCNQRDMLLQSRLMNGGRFARDVENAYRSMWLRW